MRRAEHHAINYSDACDANGNGQCDGYMDEDEGNPNASTPGVCTCPCHRSELDLDTVDDCKDWHDEFHMVGRYAPDVHLDDMGD